ncbi:hypothetical protein HK103_005878 [Boothiomyces macroporosus]|uniref:Uncharacterized protein n=1 Tax=Boothiomyces macroporosus TaxID=261099 RepID=A0AAD5Y2Z5_9FUNG|nr:hypothetical protein HK103_005878 [Boothiomyces macroporosus]
MAQGSRRNRQNELLLRENRQFLQEFQEIVNQGGSKSVLIAKLNQINETRLKLGLPPKNLEEMDLKKKTELTVENKESDESEEEIEQEEEFSNQCLIVAIEDLSHIPIPPGTPPETEGQIFKSLKQLPLIKCKTTVISNDIPPPPIIYSSKGPSLPIELAKLHPSELPVPKYRPPTELPVPKYVPPEEQLDYEQIYKNIQQTINPQKQAKPIIPINREATISQAPVMRDLVKEAAKIVPSNLKKK